MPSATLLLSQKLKSLIPMVTRKGCNDPNHCGGFEVMGKLDPADIYRVPAKVFANARDLFLRIGIVAADEHVRRPARKLRLVKLSVAHGIESLDDECRGQSFLNKLAAGASQTADQFGRHRGHVQRVRGIQHDLAFEIIDTGNLDSVDGACSMNGDRNDLAKLRCLLKRSALSTLVAFCYPRSQFCRRARPQHHLVPRPAE